MHVTLNHGTLNLGRAMKASFKAVVCVCVLGWGAEWEAMVSRPYPLHHSW